VAVRLRSGCPQGAEKIFSASVDDPSFRAILRALPQSPSLAGSGDELKNPVEIKVSMVLTATETAA
jgi:hypothetical protein